MNTKFTNLPVEVLGEIFRHLTDDASLKIAIPYFIPILNSKWVQDKMDKCLCCKEDYQTTDICSTKKTHRCICNGENILCAILCKTKLRHSCICNAASITQIVACNHQGEHPCVCAGGSDFEFYCRANIHLQ